MASYVRITMALALLLLSAPAAAQDVDIQVRIGTVKQKLIVACTAGTELGVPWLAPYHNCNETIPYVPPGRWLCVTDAYAHIYADGHPNVMDGRVHVVWEHQRAGHSYHGIQLPPSPIARRTPMAFPPNEPVELRLKNNTGMTVWVRSHLSGYLGRDASATRDEACR